VHDYLSKELAFQGPLIGGFKVLELTTSAPPKMWARGFSPHGRGFQQTNKLGLIIVPMGPDDSNLGSISWGCERDKHHLTLVPSNPNCSLPHSFYFYHQVHPNS
jgi:hypothetical protein